MAELREQFSWGNRLKTETIETFKANIGLIIGLVALCVIVSIWSEFFFTGQNMINVLRQISTNLFVASAMTMILITGGIDLSCGWVISLSGVLAAGVMYRYGLPAFAGVMVGLAVGAVVGFINGFILSRTVLPPFIITYSIGSLCRGLSYIYSNSENISIDNTSYRWLGTGNIGPVPTPVFFLLIVLIIVWLILNKTKAGKP